jgi:hypothetical protein
MLQIIGFLVLVRFPIVQFKFLGFGLVGKKYITTSQTRKLGSLGSGLAKWSLSLFTC